MMRELPARLPAVPRSLLGSFTAGHLAFLAHATQLRAELQLQREARDKAAAESRLAQDALALALHSRLQGDATVAAASLREASSLLAAQLRASAPGTELREHTLGHAAQSLVCALTLDAFFATGTLGTRPTLPPAAEGEADDTADFSDEEWLMGMISACHEIGRYATRQATRGDVASVVMSRGVVLALNEELMAFDFRNSPLRRAYDGTKYVVRALEDTLYELSLFPPPADAAAEGAAALDATEAGPRALLDTRALEAACVAYASLDESREALIKAARDPQKARECLSAEALHPTLAPTRGASVHE